MTLALSGHVPPEAVAEALRAAGFGPASVRIPMRGPEGDRYGEVAFPDPATGETRRLTVTHGTYADMDAEEVQDDRLEGPDHTHLSLGSHGRAPDAMRAVAQALGGMLRDERAGTGEFLARPPAPSP